MNMTKYENSLFTVRFIGDGFETHGVSIYDFGLTLVAFQRLINKTYLLNEGRLEKGRFPRMTERTSLALQIGERKRQSDAFALLPMLATPEVLQTLKFLGESLWSGLVGYYVQDIMSRLKREDNDDKRFYIGSINAEVVNIVNRIDASGGLNTLEIGAPGLGIREPVIFTAATKKYVNDLSKETFLGAYQKIRGRLTKLVPSSQMIEIKRAGGIAVKVRLEPKLFEEVRYNKSGINTLEIGGRPIYPIGASSKKISEFEGHDVVFVQDE
jgi:hypothetical protein